jgi:hypothetical protein
MKISAQTLSVLKNFSSINGNILVKQGSTISTISPLKNILASAQVKEKFSQEFAIYDLSQFLGAISLFEDPEFDFRENYVVISSGKRSIKYFYANKNTIIVPPNKEINLPSEDVRFEMTAADISEMLKAASILQLPEVVIESDGTDTRLLATDTKNNSSNSFELSSWAAINNDTFRMVFKADNMKLISGDYSVIISSKGLAQFTNKTESGLLMKLKLKYFIATEASSNYKSI